jgi:iron complex transport system substrate-binding protein
MNGPWKFIVHRSAFIVLLALCCARPTSPPHAVRRVISLAPNITEIIVAAGCQAKIVGTDNFSDYPEAVKGLPKVGGVEPDVEQIVALRPDLVVASASGVHPNLRRALDAVHLPLLVIRTDRLSAVAPAIGEVGQALGCPSTSSAVSLITIGLQKQRRMRAHPPRVLFAVWTDPLYVAGRATFVDDLFSITGARNAVEANGWPQYSLEALAAHPPDLLLYPNHSVTAPAVDALLRRAHAKVVAVAVDENVFTRPGPRVTLAAAELNRILDQWERSH